MADIAFPDHCKTLKTTSSTSYSYVHIPPSPSKSTILFLHDFPSSSYDWRHQISYFSSLGYGVLVPDLPGYGGTDKPVDAGSYRGKKMATEVIDILDHEKLDQVHAVAHDFGSHLLSRLVNYFPARFHSCTFIVVPYTAPGQHFDIEKVKEMTEKALGFDKFGYVRFMSREDSPAILEAHVSGATKQVQPAPENHICCCGLYAYIVRSSLLTSLFFLSSYRSLCGSLNIQISITCYMKPIPALLHLIHDL
jgi:soluble epoxide hydrolase/lipid-phosphate phosphatase